MILLIGTLGGVSHSGKNHHTMIQTSPIFTPFPYLCVIMCGAWNRAGQSYGQCYWGQVVVVHYLVELASIVQFSDGFGIHPNESDYQESGILKALTRSIK